MGRCNPPGTMRPDALDVTEFGNRIGHSHQQQFPDMPGRLLHRALVAPWFDGVPVLPWQAALIAALIIGIAYYIRDSRKPIKE